MNDTPQEAEKVTEQDAHPEELADEELEAAAGGASLTTYTGTTFIAFPDVCKTPTLDAGDALLDPLKIDKTL
jgi:hypothetical protein